MMFELTAEQYRAQYGYKKHYNNLEHRIQCGVVAYLRKSGYYVFAIGNGGKRDAITGAKLKAEGVLAGVADLEILLPNGQALFVEMKTPLGRQSKNQKYFADAVNELGFEYLVWRSLQDCMDWIKNNKREVTK